MFCFLMRRYYDSNKYQLANKIACKDFNLLLELDKNLNAYPIMNGKPGVCVIFNHKMFDSPHFHPREGTDRDVAALENALGSLGFENFVHNDLSRHEIMSQVSHVKEKINSETGCLVCCILTYGSNKGLLSARDGAYHLQDIAEQFTERRCPTLAGKPKIFMIQVNTGMFILDHYSHFSTDRLVGHLTPRKPCSAISRLEPPFTRTETSFSLIHLSPFKPHGAILTRGPLLFRFCAMS